MSQIKKNFFSFMPFRFYYYSRTNDNNTTEIIIGNNENNNNNNNGPKKISWLDKLSILNSFAYVYLNYFQNNPLAITTIITSPFSTMFSLFIKGIIYSVGGYIVSNLKPKYTNIIFNLTMTAINVYMIHSIVNRA